MFTNGGPLVKFLVVSRCLAWPRRVWWHMNPNPGPAMLLVTARPAGRSRYTVFVDGKILPMPASHTPLFSAARVLIECGLDPATELALQYEGTDTIAFRMTAGAAAALVAVEPDRSRVTVVPSTSPPADRPARPPGIAQDGTSAPAERERRGGLHGPPGGRDGPFREAL